MKKELLHLLHSFRRREAPSTFLPFETLAATLIRLKETRMQFSDLRLFKHMDIHGNQLYSFFWAPYKSENGKIIASHEAVVMISGSDYSGMWFKDEDGEWIPPLTFSKQPLKKLNDVLGRAMSASHKDLEKAAVYEINLEDLAAENKTQN